MADLLAGEPKQKSPEEELLGSLRQAARGGLEAIPFYGERLAEKAGLPMPETFPERLTRRGARNLPYALIAGPFTGGIPAAIGYAGSVGAGQLAEELGLPEAYQPVAEMAGGGVAQAGRQVAGRTLGYIQEPLESLAKKASSLKYEIGPGARTSQGMKYGAGDTPDSAIRNLTRFTEEATARAGNTSKVVDPEWIKTTQRQLGNEVDQIFAGRVFNSTPQYQQEIYDIVRKAEGAFGEQGNLARTIIERNIGGQRAGGALLSPQFRAQDLRDAITEVNYALSNAKGNQAKILHDLKDSLENLAQANLPRNLATQYEDWRKKYNSFATLRDAIQIEGRGGITAAGQVNPQKLLDIITNRTGGQATRSPLFNDLAELGDILKVKDVSTPGTFKALTEVLTESPIAKTIAGIVQPRVPTQAGIQAARGQTISPLQRYLQFPTGPRETKSPETESELRKMGGR